MQHGPRRNAMLSAAASLPPPPPLLLLPVPAAVVIAGAAFCVPHCRYYTAHVPCAAVLSITSPAAFTTRSEREGREHVCGPLCLCPPPTHWYALIAHAPAQCTAPDMAVMCVPCASQAGPQVLLPFVHFHAKYQHATKTRSQPHTVLTSCKVWRPGWCGDALMPP